MEKLTYTFPRQLSSSTPHAPKNKILPPCKASTYQHEVTRTVSAQVLRKRRVAKSYHDSSAKPLPPLVIGQPIRVKAHPQQAHRNWKPGVIVDSVAPRSYIVEVYGRKYRRNRVHLRETIQSSRSQPNGQQTSTRLRLLTTQLTRMLAKIKGKGSGIGWSRGHFTP